jgi:CO dehydrogenase nickel-insertion accessory protein CooC1
MQVICIMVIGVLGKGGSGKSTVATQLALFLHGVANKQVLAIDVDHNLDLAANLTAGEHRGPYFGASMSELYGAVGATPGERYDDVLLRDATPRFRLSPPDAYTSAYTATVAEGLFLMAAGPQTEAVLHGQACSHSLGTPLKLYLPLLALAPNEVAVVDEKAGADGVSTGIVTGMDVALVVVEPAYHSVKTARQIAELLSFYHTPYRFVANKVATAEDLTYITEAVGEVAMVAPADAALKRNPHELSALWHAPLSTLTAALPVTEVGLRPARSRAKFERNRAFLGV